jgi:hypothetical protein
MALIDLPNELFDMVVKFSLPQSFENLATTCKRVYARCTPFIKRHNELRTRFRDFAYYTHRRDNLVAASDLISLIAADPIVAQYIRTANLIDDSQFIKHQLCYSGPSDSPRVPSIEDGGPIVQLFASSEFLRSAQLDWREYYSTFSEDVREKRYSQHGSIFLLTLLEHTENVTIPCSWKPNAAADRLLYLLAEEAICSKSSSSGLRSVISFHGRKTGAETGPWDLSSVGPILTLPQLKFFSGPGSFLRRGRSRTHAFQGSPRMSDTLQVVHLGGCCIDDVGIANFLEHTPRLKTFIYSHDTRHAILPPDWDICKFINAVAREAGSHLIELSVTSRELRGSILPGKASTRGFQKLQKFEFPLELAMCNINTAGITGNIAASLQRLFNGSSDPFVRDLIPSSVTHLALKSKAMRPHDIALDALFRNFCAIRRTQLPHLQKVHIDCKQDSDDVYKQKCNKIVEDCMREDVVVHLEAYEYSGGITWDG